MGNLLSKKGGGRFLGEVAICLEGGVREVHLAKMDDIKIMIQGKSLTGKTVKASFQIGKNKMEGTILPENCERFDSCKAALKEHME